MNYKKPKEEKRYYSIGEVAKMFDVAKSLIRFWETEFDYLKPHKNSNGERRFTQQNIDQLSLIYHLVKERGFTLDGAKREIIENKEKINEKMHHLNKLKAVRKRLVNIRKML
jgi:DNA-binding transcriptional MerR regulator